ncbi:MAG TPA: hypothetical protein VJK48_00040 [Chlamydiales bacterium]|nr:hypothetical protein [Chlamydiales bacterium]
MKPRTAILFSGFLWFAIGASLIYKGLGFFAEAVQDGDSFVFHMQDWLGTPHMGGFIWMGAALFVGFLKGRFVFTKTVQRIVTRIYSLPQPLRFRSVYPPAYWGLIGGMALLGMSLRYLSIPLDLRGFIDVAIGFALLNGSYLYFQAKEPDPNTVK